MTNQATAIEFFKKQSKILLKKVEARDPQVIARVNEVIRDTSDFSLMKAQHVVAVESGFTKWEDLIRASTIEIRLAITMSKEPQLSFFGIGVYGEENLSREEYLGKLRELRNELRRNSQRVEQVANWLRSNVMPVKTINTKRTSYGLKHITERHLKTYIGNGVFIAAALVEGYQYQILCGGPNVSFGMSERSLKVLERFRYQSEGG